MLVADAEMDGSPVGQLFAGTGKHLLEQWFRLLKLVLLQGPQSGFVVLQSLRDARILRDSCFFGGSLLSHVKNFSCARRNGDSLIPETRRANTQVSLKVRVLGNCQRQYRVPSYEYRAKLQGEHPTGLLGTSIPVLVAS